MTFMNMTTVFMILLAILGISLAILAPNPVTIGCAIWNVLMLGAVIALDKFYK